jgi:hypothetical protein
MCAEATDNTWIQKQFADEFRGLNSEEDMPSYHVFQKETETSGQSFFFSQDSDCHWYQLPSSLREKWNEFTANDIADDDFDRQDEFETLFGQYRTGGDISGIDFVVVKTE